MSGFNTKGRPLVKFNLISQSCCPFSNMVIRNPTGSPMGALICDTLYGAAILVEWTQLSQYHIYVYVYIHTIGHRYALHSEPCGVYCEDYRGNWHRYNITVLYNAYTNDKKYIYIYIYIYIRVNITKQNKNKIVYIFSGFYCLFPWSDLGIY